MRRVVPEALASRKVAYREVYTEGSETAKSGTDVQELHKRLKRSDEQAHLCNIQNTNGEYLLSRCSGNRRKEDVLTWGGLFRKKEKSADTIVLERGRVEC